MIHKIAKFKLEDCTPLMDGFLSESSLIKTASGKRISLPSDSPKSQSIQAEITKHPTALFFRAKAIVADLPNTNGDYFSEEEITGSYKSFEGVPFFTNHDNQNVENARGKIIFAEYVPEEKAVYTIAFVDREAFPHICRSIEEEYVTGVSMGALSGGSMILLSDLSEKPIEDINIGDIVISHTGASRKVTNVHNEYLGKSMHKFDLETYHRTPMFTEDHPIFSVSEEDVVSDKKVVSKEVQRNKYERETGAIDSFIGQDQRRPMNYASDFKEANSVSVGDYFLIPSKFDLQDGKSPKSDLYYLAGAFLGDGFLKKNKNSEYEAVTFCLGINEIELCSKIHGLINKYSDHDPYNTVCESRNGIYISVYDKKLAKWLSEFVGTGSKNKRISLPIKFEDDAKQLLAGYLDTDGCIVDKANQEVSERHFGGFQISSVNIGLLEDVQQLVISLGHISVISTFARTISKNSVVKIDTIKNTLSVGPDASSIFDYSIKYGNSRFDIAEIKAGRSFILKNDSGVFMACPVKSVEIVSFNEPVYDLTVDVDESYVANGIAVHNCSVEYSVCNICENKAEKVDEYCPHIQNRKGRTFSGTARNVNTGEVKQFKNELVFEYNYGIKFIELSAVVDPAEPSCRIEGIFTNDEFVRKVANVQNHFYMIKDAAIDREASQEDLDQLNGTLKTLEDIAVELVKNRQQIEVDFASQLVKILADLQLLVDELTAAGFGQIESIPGVADDMGEFGDLEGGSGGDLAGDVPTGPADGIQGVSGQPQSKMVANEISSSIPSGNVGNVGVQSTGISSKPARPNLPFIQPRAFDITKLEKVASVLPSLVILRNNMYDQIGEDEMGRRRTISAKNEQKRETIEILSNSWQEKQDFFGYIKQVPSIQNNNIKLSVKKKDDSFIIIAENKDPKLASSEQKVWTYEDLSDKEREFIKNNPHEAAVQLLESFSGSLNNKKGAEEMATREVQVKSAGADSVNKDPQVTTEVQLEEQRALYHPRTGEEAHVTHEVQLDPKRTGEPTVTTEVQLEDANLKLHPRAGDVPSVTQEVQLEEDRSGVSPRRDNEKHVTQEVQLKEEGYQTGTESQVITEVQLNDVDAPWSRAAKRDASLFKSASEHMDAVLDSVADSVIETGCTPSEACAVASDMVGTTQARNEFLGDVLGGEEGERVDLKARLAFWGGKNLRVSSSGVADIHQSLVNSLRRLASDETMNPDVIISAIDILSSDDDGIASLSEKVDEKVESSKTETVAKVNVKSELREALKKNRIARESERQEWETSQNGEESRASLGDADIMIETTFDEAGLDKSAARDSGFRNSLVSFTKGALAGEQMRLASITNVTISGDTISIAVQTDDNPAESVEIPIGGDALPEPDGQLPEGDMGGENLELGVSEVSTPAPGAYASVEGKIEREAQMFGGGDTAGVPGQDGEQGQASEAPSAPGEPGGEGVQSLTTDKDVQMDIPTVGEQQVPWAICPECGSNDVDVENKDGDISGNCKHCGAEYEAMIKKEIEFKITKPTRSVGEQGLGGAPAEPEIPALPVAAQTRLDKNTLVRIASNKAKYGHVCPSCGNNHCEASVDEDGSAEFTCEACGTDVFKEILVSVNDPDNSVQRIAWDVRPKTDCEGCEEAAQKFASRIKWERIISAAAGKDFPEANCKELIAKQYGGNTSATSGPCKGKLLVECICSQLKTLGFTSARHLTRLADASMQLDSMDTCVEKQMKDKGFNRKEAQLACNCLKKTYAAQGKNNIFVVAFEDDIASGIEKDLTILDLGTINEVLMGTEEEQADEFADRSFEDALNDIEESKKPDVTEAASKPVVQATEVEIPLEVGAEATAEITAEAEVELTAEVVVETVEAQPENKELTAEEEKEMALAMQTHKLRRVGEEVVKVAGVPTQVESIEGNVEATVPRSQATIRTEGPATFAKPQVPESKATMGNEEALIEGLPNVPVDSSYMGQEKTMQEGMPAINNEIKGTVIAEDGKTVVEAKQMKEVDSVEPNTTTPRADATMGEEEKFTADTPKVPAGKATMGNEEALTEKGPDVPIDNTYMGQEKKMQEGMPEMNDEMLKQVKMKKEVQLERIANARKMEAIKVASKLLATERIPEVAYDDVVTTLAVVEIDKISVVAERMFPAVARTASAQVVAEDGMVTAGTHSGPAIVMATKTEPEEGQDLASKLQSHFTIGSRDFDRKLVENDLK